MQYWFAEQGGPQQLELVHEVQSADKTIVEADKNSIIIPKNTTILFIILLYVILLVIISGNMGDDRLAFGLKPLELIYAICFKSKWR